MPAVLATQDLEHPPPRVRETIMRMAGSGLAISHHLDVPRADRSKRRLQAGYRRTRRDARHGHDDHLHENTE